MSFEGAGDAVHRNAHADAVLEGEIGTELLAGVSKNSNIHAMSFTYSGGYRVVPANFRADTVDAWKGQTVRTSRSPVAVETFKLLGAEPKEHIALEEMNEYADRGEIAAGESTYVRIFPLDQYKSFEFVNDTAHSLFLTSIIVNQEFMKSFDAETRAILSDAAFNAARKERRESVADIPNILAECEAKGVEVVRMSTEEKAKFKEVKDPHDTSKILHQFDRFETVSPGKLNAEEYDKAVGDLVAYLQWMGEPAQNTRKRLGVVVLIFMAVLATLAWRLNASYWKEVK